MIHYIAFITSLVIAAVAAYFSIAGLVAIFSGAAISVIIMATVLEIGKLVTATWLHIQWDVTKWAYKLYLSAAVVILMFITSMGIFGYLSKAHLEQTISLGGNNELQITNLERQIDRQQSIIADAETVLSQLDSQVATLIEYDRIRGPSGSIAVRESQSEERSLLNQTIDAAYVRIDELQTDLAPLQQQSLALEAEIGPLKYIAELIYGDEAESYFDTAVRWIIILIVSVFDPLAVMLLIVSTGGIVGQRQKAEEAPPIVRSDQIYNLD